MAKSDIRILRDQTICSACPFTNLFVKLVEKWLTLEYDEQTMLLDPTQTMMLGRWNEAQKRGDIQGRC